MCDVCCVCGVWCFCDIIYLSFRRSSFRRFVVLRICVRCLKIKNYLLCFCVCGWLLLWIMFLVIGFRIFMFLFCLFLCCLCV